MALTKDRKKELLQRAQDIFANSNSAVFVQTQGMGANDSIAMRAEMTGEDVGYAVIKKTLTKLLRGMFVNVINSPIQGMAIALSKIAEKKEA